MRDSKVSIDNVFDYLDKPKGKVTIGVDGFVDEVWNVVSYRKGASEYVLFDKMNDFAGAIFESDGGGFGADTIRKRRTYGGFTANTGKAISRLGVNLTMLAMFGKNNIDTVFSEFSDSCKVISIGDPAICQVYEFSDGKIMLPHVEDTASLDFKQLTASVSLNVLEEAYGCADVVCLGYWSQLRFFDELVTKICENFLKPGAGGKRRKMFFDFAEIRTRERSALDETLQLLGMLNKDVSMTLSLNEHEAEVIYSLVGKQFKWQDFDANVGKELELVRDKIGLDELVVHTPHFAIAASAFEETAMLKQRYCENPIITTGAGDNFNGGYIVACVDSGLNLHERLFVSNATTGFYIRNGHSPDVNELKAEMSAAYDSLR